MTARVIGIVLIATAAAHPALAQDDEDDLTFEQKIIRNIMSGLGANVGPGAGIDYRERSPLVVPPTRDLPPPQATADVPNPAWPRDPNQQARKKKTARAPTVRDVELWNDPGAALRPDELNRGRVAGAGAVTAPQRNDEDTAGRALPPSMLGYTGGLFGSIFNTTRKPETTTFTHEPPRVSLIEPPPGYQTPSPTQPYGIGLQKWTPTIPNATDRGTAPN